MDKTKGTRRMWKAIRQGNTTGQGALCWGQLEKCMLTIVLLLH
jgi:hypothetical protein